MRTFASLMAHSQSALFFDLSFQLLILRALLNVCLYTIPPSVSWSSSWSTSLGMFLANGHEQFSAAKVRVVDIFSHDSQILRTFKSLSVLSASVIIINYSVKGAFSKCYLTTLSTAKIIQRRWCKSIEHWCNENDTPSGKPKYWKRNTCPCATSSTTNPTRGSVFQLSSSFRQLTLSPS
jgi:hypothetical protein